MGTFLVSVVTSLTGSPSLGVLSIGVLLIVGFMLLVRLSRMIWGGRACRIGASGYCACPRYSFGVIRNKHCDLRAMICPSGYDGIS